MQKKKEVERGERTIIHYSLHSKKESLILSLVDGNHLVVLVLDGLLQALDVAVIFQFNHSSAQGVAHFCAFHTLIGQDCLLDPCFTVTAHFQLVDGINHIFLVNKLSCSLIIILTSIML